MIRLPNRLFFEQVEAMLAEGREVRIRIRGHSMFPMLRNDRDCVILRACTDTSQLRRGDVALFRSSGNHILHRIVRREGDRLTMAGDGNCGLTEQCTTRDIAGVVTRIVRPSGRIVGCDSLRWMLPSRLWLSIPTGLRRLLLRVLRRIGYK